MWILPLLDYGGVLNHDKTCRNLILSCREECTVNGKNLMSIRKTVVKYKYTTHFKRKVINSYMKCFN